MIGAAILLNSLSLTLLTAVHAGADNSCVESYRSASWKYERELRIAERAGRDAEALAKVARRGFVACSLSGAAVAPTVACGFVFGGLGLVSVFGSAPNLRRIQVFEAAHQVYQIYLQARETVEAKEEQTAESDNLPQSDLAIDRQGEMATWTEVVRLMESGELCPDGRASVAPIELADRLRAWRHSLN